MMDDEWMVGWVYKAMVFWVMKWNGGLDWYHTIQRHKLFR